jgi:radical SAM superfamily enzyme YgiQ (UPF0313 family)
MSNLGVHAIYRLLNGYPNVVCERVFWERGQTTAPVSIESGRPLSDFAAIAFSVTYELDYFNVVAILRAAALPLRSEERDEDHPLVIAGGACITANPMPLAPFFDLLAIGEAEPILPPLVEALAEGAGGDREELLRALAEIPGVYLPASGNSVTRQWTADLDARPVTTTILTRDTELGNLFLIEAERGCGWGCRFCLVSGAFRPVRFGAVDGIVAAAEEGLRHRKRIGLVGAAVTDHPRIEELVGQLRGLGAELSISSLRVKPLSPVVLEAVVKSGAKTIALAPEAGSERLRRVIGKRITEDDILAAVGRVAEAEVRQLKLYFMIGLPTETDEDIDEIIRLARACKAVLDRRRGGGRLTLTVSPFVPKANTPFQWLGMTPAAVLESRLALLKYRLQPRGIAVKNESLAWSLVQGALARGDASLAGVLASVEAVSLAGWRKALATHGISGDPALATLPKDTALPWDVIDSGIGAEHLGGELDRALAPGDG